MPHQTDSRLATQREANTAHNIWFKIQKKQKGKTGQTNVERKKKKPTK